MSSSIPYVIDDRLYRSNTESDPIVIGTPEWYEWLEQHIVFTFIDQTGTYTAYKSTPHTKGSSWKAWSRHQGKLYRNHLGYSNTLTLGRLQAAAQAFALEYGPEELAEVSSKQSEASRLPMRTSPRMELTFDPSMALIQAKIYRPRKRSDLIKRTYLLERLSAGLDGKVTLVSAPAGYGKSTLLAQWLQTIDRPTAWLSLDEHDNEPRLFVQALTAALQSAFSDMFQGLASLSEAPRFPSVDHVVSLLINDLADVPDNLILVLDDYHLIHNREIHTLFDQLIEHLPPQLYVVLSTRSDPPLPLARWHARGYLNGLRPTDLRFTREETEAFLKRMLGHGLAPEIVVALEEQTEGWIALLRLAALSMRNAFDQARFLERFRSYPHSSISTYLLEEILSQQGPLIQEFLIKASLLKQFCSELCVALLGSETSYDQVHAVLNWLERSNVLVIPLDERQGWYRFHHLFGKLLRQNLHEHFSTEELAELHRRASAWYGEQGLIEQAIEHSLEAGDAAGAARWVEAQFFPAFEQEMWVQMEYWLRLLPEEQIQVSPVLLFARVWILQARGQLKDTPRLLTTAEQLLGTDESATIESEDSSSRLLRTLIATGWSHFQYFTGQFQLSLESARSAWKWLPPGREYVSSIILTLLAWSYQANGREEVALLELNNALSEGSTHLNSTTRLLFAQANVYLAEGKLHQVERTARHLLQISREANMALSQQFAHWLLGVVHYEWNELDAAVYHFSAVVSNKHQAHFWVVHDAMRGLALAYQAKELGNQAQEAARDLLEMVQEQHNTHELMMAYAFCGRLALMQDEVEVASQWLEMAGEQEVLGPMMFFEDPLVTRARMLLARGDEESVAQGQLLLTRLSQYVESIYSTRKTIQVLALQAWACDVQGHEAEAVEVLERALALASPGGFIRTFADLASLMKVLQNLRKRRKSHREAGKRLDDYLQRMIAAMSSGVAPPVPTEAMLRREGLESLTNRELRILRLLGQDLSNKEIARELVLTTGTVKVHTSNVYRKLKVNNRRAAVSIAKALGLLAAGDTPVSSLGVL